MRVERRVVQGRRNLMFDRATPQEELATRARFGLTVVELVRLAVWKPGLYRSMIAATKQPLFDEE